VAWRAACCSGDLERDAEACVLIPCGNWKLKQDWPGGDSAGIRFLSLKGLALSRISTDPLIRESFRFRPARGSGDPSAH